MSCYYIVLQSKYVFSTGMYDRRMYVFFTGINLLSVAYKGLKTHSNVTFETACSLRMSQHWAVNVALAHK